jgi:hypothetical protein
MLLPPQETKEHGFHAPHPGCARTRPVNYDRMRPPGRRRRVLLLGRGFYRSRGSLDALSHPGDQQSRVCISWGGNVRLMPPNSLDKFVPVLC